MAWQIGRNLSNDQSQEFDLTETHRLEARRQSQDWKRTRSGDAHDASWNRSLVSEFKAVIAVIAFVNLWATATETDSPDSLPWFWINSGFLLVYAVELLAQVRELRSHWQSQDLAMPLLNLCIVVLGAPDVFLQAQKAELRSGLVARMLFLARFLRVVKVVRVIPSLHKFLEVLLTMVSNFAWVLAIIFLFCFMLALVLTRLLGHELLLWEGIDERLRHQVVADFQDFRTSLFTVFRLCTVDDWTRIAEPLIRLHPLWKLFFVFFIASMSWTMLSLLTAVAAQTLMQVNQTSHAETSHMKATRAAALLNLLFAELQMCRRIKTGCITREEFVALLDEDSFQQKLLDLHVHLHPRNYDMALDIFGYEDSDTISIDELVYGLCRLQEELSTKHVAGIRQALYKLGTEERNKTCNAQQGFRDAADTQLKVLIHLAAADNFSQESARSFQHQLSALETVSQLKRPAALLQVAASKAKAKPAAKPAEPPHLSTPRQRPATLPAVSAKPAVAAHAAEPSQLSALKPPVAVDASATGSPRGKQSLKKDPKGALK